MQIPIDLIKNTLLIIIVLVAAFQLFRFAYIMTKKFKGFKKKDEFDFSEEKLFKEARKW